MKVSVSLRPQDLAFVDQYSEQNARTRSSVIQQAIALLREAELEAQYDQAFGEWQGTEDAALWDSVTGDGLEELD